MLTTIFLVATAFTNQSPKAGLPFEGRWVLKSATVDGKATKPSDMKAFLKHFGGVSTDMVYKFDEPAEDGDRDCYLNDVGGMYSYAPKTRTLFAWGDDKGREYKQTFDLKMVGKNLELRFKEDGKVVKLTFTSD